MPQGKTGRISPQAESALRQQVRHAASHVLESLSEGFLTSAEYRELQMVLARASHDLGLLSFAAQESFPRCPALNRPISSSVIIVEVGRV